MSELHEGFKRAVSRHVDDGLYIVSMDHSPSEQLDGSQWHTSVLILSPGVEHSELAKQVAARITKFGRLSKWSNRNKHAYRDAFAKTFFELLPDFPVIVLAISAEEGVIRSAKKHFLHELGIADSVQTLERPGRSPRYQIGPVINGETRDEIIVSLSENRFLMSLFIAHFVIRMHQEMWEGMRLLGGTENFSLNWNFLADKFPGPVNQDYDLCFQLLLSRKTRLGRIIWGYFLEGDAVDIDLLADNLAGYLNGALLGKYIVSDKEITLNSDENGSLFYWEKWSDPS